MIRRVRNFFLAALCIAAPSIYAQDISVGVSTDTVTVGERFYLSVVARHDFAADPVFPDPILRDSLVFGDVEVLRTHARNSYRSDGRRVDSLVYEVTTFALDTARVAPFAILFTAGEDTFSVATPELLVPVASLVPADAEDIRDVAPPVEFTAPLWPYVAGALALLALAAIVAFMVWRRRKRGPAVAPVAATPPPPPHVEALQRLRALEKVDLRVRETLKPFYVDLSDTLRYYLARRLHVNAMETTTGELVRELTQTRNVPPNLLEQLRDVLSVSDLVKFADAEPPPERGSQALKDSRDFVQNLEHALRDAALKQNSDARVEHT